MRDTSNGDETMSAIQREKCLLWFGLGFSVSIHFDETCLLLDCITIGIVDSRWYNLIIDSYDYNKVGCARAFEFGFGILVSSHFDETSMVTCVRIWFSDFSHFLWWWEKRWRKLGMENGGGEDKDNCCVDENIGDDGVSGSVFGQEMTFLLNLIEWRGTEEETVG